MHRHRGSVAPIPASAIFGLIDQSILMKIQIVVFDGFDELDAIAPYEVF